MSTPTKKIYFTPLQKVEFVEKLVVKKEYTNPDFSLEILEGVRHIQGVPREKIQCGGEFWFGLREFSPKFERVSKDGLSIVGYLDAKNVPLELPERFLMTKVREANHVVCGLIAFVDKSPNERTDDQNYEDVLRCLEKLNHKHKTCIALERSGSPAKAILSRTIDAIVVGDGSSHNATAIRGITLLVFPVVLLKHRPLATGNEILLTCDSFNKLCDDTSNIKSQRMNLSVYHYMRNILRELSFLSVLMRTYVEVTETSYIKTSGKRSLDSEVTIIEFMCFVPPADDENDSFIDKSRTVEYSDEVFPSEIEGSRIYNPRRDHLSIPNSPMFIPY